MFLAHPFPIKSYETVKSNKNNSGVGCVVENEDKIKDKKYDDRCVSNEVIKSTSLHTFLNRNTPSPKLLCAYEYFINDEQNKTISIGYNSEDNFKAQIIIRSYVGKTYPNFISFTLKDFKKLFSAKVEEFFNPICNLSLFYDKTKPHEKNLYDEAVRLIQEDRNDKIKHGYSIPILDTSNFSLFERYSEDSEPTLSITGWNSHKNDFITLTKKEIDNLKEMLDFFEVIWVNTRSAAFEVQEYYWEYVKQCCLKKVEILPESSFFTPPNQKTINVFRLFNEIPIYCRRKLYNDIAISRNSYEQKKRVV